jgi:hypothetical protein
VSLMIVTPDHPAPIEFAQTAVHTYPLDSILLIPTSDRPVHGLQAAFAAMAVAPWLPMAVAVPGGSISRLRFAIGGTAVHAVSVTLPGDVELATAAVRAAIRNRGCPATDEVTDFLTRVFGFAVASPAEEGPRGPTADTPRAEADRSCDWTWGRRMVVALRLCGVDHRRLGETTVGGGVVQHARDLA